MDVSPERIAWPTEPPTLRRPSVAGESAWAGAIGQPAFCAGLPAKMQPCPRGVRSTVGVVFMCASSGTAVADQGPAEVAGRQSVDDAWWTGSLLASPGAAMPKGHLVIESYLFDKIDQAHYDDSGVRGSVPRTDGFASQTYFFYGLTDTVTLGLAARFGYQHPSQGPSSSRIGVGDTTVRAQWELAQWRAERWVPTISLMLAETLPTGRFDRLGARLSDGHRGRAPTMIERLFFPRPVR